MLKRAEDLVPEHVHDSSTSMCLIVTAGPRQQILRPKELNEAFALRILDRARSGPYAVFSPWSETQPPRHDGEGLLIIQEKSSILIDEQGTVRIVTPPPRRKWKGLEASGLVVIDIARQFERMARFAAGVIDDIDSRGRITDVAIIGGMIGWTMMGWKEEEDFISDGGSWTMASGARKPIVRLRPPTRKRAALTYEATEIAQELTELLRRQLMSNQ